MSFRNALKPMVSWWVLHDSVEWGRRHWIWSIQNTKHAIAHYKFDKTQVSDSQVAWTPKENDSIKSVTRIKEIKKLSACWNFGDVQLNNFCSQSSGHTHVDGLRPTSRKEQLVEFPTCALNLPARLKTAAPQVFLFVLVGGWILGYLNGPASRRAERENHEIFWTGELRFQSQESSPSWAYSN